MEQIIKKNGLLYTKDLHTVLGVDIESNEFDGRIPFGAHYIDDEVFTECPYEKIDLTDSIVGIGVALFKDSKRLKSVKLPEKVEELPPYLFSGCSALEKVKMPNMVYSFPEGLFQGCSSLRDVPFRAGIKELPDYVLEGCSSLLSLVIPPTVERISKRAVADCSKLMSLVLPASVTYIDESAFDGCTNIHNIRVSEDNKIFFVSEEDGCLYERTAQGDKLRLAVKGVEAVQIKLFKDNVDDENEPFFTNEDFEEEDDDFSAEIEAGSDEESCTQEPCAEVAPVQNAVNQQMPESEVEKYEDEEIAAASGLESVMPNVAEDTVDEIIESSNQPIEEDDDNGPAVTVKISDTKTLAILDAVQFSKIIECEPEGTPPSDSDLFVISEVLENSDAEKSFTRKLESVAKRFAQLKDFKRIFFLYGLPIEDAEFEEFFKMYVSDRNVVFACEAASPSTLSAYGKRICELSRISLSHEDLVEQKKNINNKNDILIKLVIQDKK